MRYLPAISGPKSIRVNAISAGAIKTPGSRRHLRVLQHSQASTAKPHRCVAASTPPKSPTRAMFLLSKAPRAVTGEMLMVDAGFHAMGWVGTGEAGSLESLKY